MKQVVEWLIYLVFTLFIFIVLWKVTAVVWEAFVPWNDKTDFVMLFGVTPILLAGSFILSSLSFKFVKDST